MSTTCVLNHWLSMCEPACIVLPGLTVARCRQYHIDGRTTWDNPLQSVADQSPNAPAATGDVDETITASSSPASIKRHVEARIAARHQERAAALALVAVVHESPEVASKLISLQKGRAARGRRNTRPTRRLAQRRTPGAANSLQHQHQHQRLKVEEVETQEQDMESGGRGWGVGLDGILEASVGLDGSIDQLAFDEMVESAEKQDSEARTPRTPAGRPADGNCPAPPATPPPASGARVHECGTTELVPSVEMLAQSYLSERVSVAVRLTRGSRRAGVAGTLSSACRRHYRHWSTGPFHRPRGVRRGAATWCPYPRATSWRPAAPRL